VNDHLRALERKGYLTREDMKSRALRPAGPRDLPSPTTVAARVQPHSAERPASFNDLGDDGDLVEIPVLGRIAAGLPLLAQENVTDTVRIDRGLVRGGRDVFGLRVERATR
jgi:repressor LexA